MQKLPPPLHHSLLLNAQAKDGSTAWSLEIGVIRSKNGFVKKSDLTAILEKRDPSSGVVTRKVVRTPLPFVQELTNPQALIEKPWSIGPIQSSNHQLSGQVRTREGDFSWNLKLEGGHLLDHSPLPGWVEHRTLSTQIPIQGHWKIGDFEWNSSDGGPVLGSLHLRGEQTTPATTVRFHSQFVTQTSDSLLHCADGMQLTRQRLGVSWIPSLTRIAAFDALKGSPRFSLWRALRSQMLKTLEGWSFRTEQSGLELRGKIHIEPKHIVALRQEDVRGSAFYRSSTRMAELEILILAAGKPSGHFKSPRSTWVEWTSLEKPENTEIF